MIAVLLAAAGMLIVGLGRGPEVARPSPVVDDAPVSDGVPVADRSASAEATGDRARLQAPADAHEREAAAPAAAIRGRVLWADGTPAEGVLLSGPFAREARSASDGSFRLDLVDAYGAGPEREPIEITALAPCWVKDPVKLQWPPATAGTNVESGLATLRIPNRIDVRIRCRIDPRVVLCMREDGYVRVVVTASDAHVAVFPPNVAFTSFDMDSVPCDHVLQITDCDFISVAAKVSARSHRDPLTDQYLVAGWTRRLDRHSPGELAISVDDRNLLEGIVVDHLGRPIPDAKVDVSIPEPASATGFDTTWLETGDQGRFRFYGSPGDAVQVVARHVGAEAASVDAVVGGEVARVSVDLSGHVELRVTKGGMPVTHYLCGTRSWLFGEQKPPDLSRHDDGRSWLPHLADGQRLFLTWRDGARWREQELPRALLQPRRRGEPATVDTLDLPDVPLGTLRIAGLDKWRKCRVSLELLSPRSSLPRGSQGAGFWKGAEPRFLGVPAGRYRLTVKELRKGQGRFEVFASELTLDGTDRTIDVAGGLRR
ncbi:MAG TPA: carboxypeptidase regulatory-like domain-containing protein [bacterium]|nr:carboxypeptidase regulatory-like domain-containing protein [bacterium]